ncbi:hypothetical protein BV25DRAFT_1571468 [Artomyces pyxidatus]|uniref:Uncharacterized protein n=1 Tax=Artomyces pyxidatus TaxID=48021 RepID=A0ACB8SKV2_9AGAM|nr:hypothetical protein BV25DRAFT_1571468 [Artomyces pyxidatus]
MSRTPSPISKLPSGALARVFKFLMLLSEPGFGGRIFTHNSGKGRPSLGWIEVTYVCRRWRQVALDNPSLWGRISFRMSSSWLKEMLARSRSAPIVITETGYYYHPVPQPIPPVFDMQMSRISTIDICFNPWLLPAVTDALNSLPAPRLELLYLGQEHYESAPIVHLPRSPVLRRLRFNNLTFSWKSMASSDLSHLEISVKQNFPSTLGKGPQANPAQCEDFISFLQNTPRLETLILEHCLPPHQERPSEAVNVIQLPHLARLGLYGTTLDVIGVLELIDILPATKLSLTCCSNDESGEEALTAISFFSSRFEAGSMNLIPLRTLALTSNRGDGTLDVGLYSSSPTITRVHEEAPNFAPAATSSFVLRLRWANKENQDVMPIARQIYSVLPLRDLEGAYIALPKAQWTAQDWAAAFRRSPAVKHLVVRRPETCSLGEALFQRVHAAAGGFQSPAVPGGLLFPQLESLTLHETDFVTTQDAFHDVFYASLKERAACNAGLQRLFLSSIFMRDFARFRSYEGVVGSVVPVVDREEDEDPQPTRHSISDDAEDSSEDEDDFEEE